MDKVDMDNAQKERRYGNSKHCGDLPNEITARQNRLARWNQDRKEMEVETAAAAERLRQE